MIGVLIIEGYGLFEILLCVMVNFVDCYEFNGMIGLLLFFIEVLIWDDDGKELLLG